MGDDKSEKNGSSLESEDTEIAQLEEANNFEETPEDDITEQLMPNEDFTRHWKKKWKIFGIVIGIVAIAASGVVGYQLMKNSSVQKQLELGQSYMDDGNYIEARLAFDAAIEIDPKAVEAYEKKAETYLVEDNFGEAENLLNMAQGIEQTSYGDLLLGKVYYETDRSEKGQEKIAQAIASGKLDTSEYNKVSDILGSTGNFGLLENLYEEQLSQTRNTEEKIEIYQKLLEVYLFSEKSEEEVNSLIQGAQEAVGSDYISIVMDEKTLENIETEVNLIYNPSLLGLADDFASLGEFDLKWGIYKSILSSMIKNEPVHEVGEKEGGLDTYFLSLDAIRSYLQNQINPVLVIPEESQVYNNLIQSIDWLPEEKGFKWRYIDSFATNTYIYIDKVFKVDDMIYVEASELDIRDAKNADIFEPDETLYVSCNGQNVGTAKMTGFTEESKTTDYDFSFTTDDMARWTYVLQESPEGNYYIQSKMLNGTTNSLASGTADSSNTNENTTVKNETGIHRYSYVLSDGGWNEAFTKAKEMGGYLAHIDSNEELSYITQEIENRGYHKMEFYIGGRRASGSHDYYWVDANNNFYGDRLNDKLGSWFWMKNEPSFQDGTIEEAYLNIFFYNSDSIWVGNDGPENIVALLPEFAGRTGFIVEFDE